MEIGDTLSVTYCGMDSDLNHTFDYKIGDNHHTLISVHDEHLNGKSLLRKFRSTLLKRNTCFEYTVLGGA